MHMLKFSLCSFVHVKELHRVPQRLYFRPILSVQYDLCAAVVRFLLHPPIQPTSKDLMLKMSSIDVAFLKSVPVQDSRA